MGLSKLTHVVFNNLIYKILLKKIILGILPAESLKFFSIHRHSERGRRAQARLLQFLTPDLGVKSHAETKNFRVYSVIAHQAKIL